MKRRGISLPHGQKLPSTPASTASLERQYERTIRRLILPLKTAITQELLPKLPGIVQSFKDETRVDSVRKDVTYGEKISEVIEGIKFFVKQEFDRGDIEREVTKTADNVQNFNKTQVDKQMFTVLGVNPIRSEPYLEAKVKAFTEENISRIRSIADNFFPELEGMVRQSIELGESTSKLSKKILNTFFGADKKLRKKAKLIARDQIGKFFGSLTEVRQKETGVKEYIWSTSRDERVRGAPEKGIGGRYPKAKPSHVALHGKKFSWDKPPVSGVKGEKQHPGVPIQCRCVALPVLEDFK